MMPYDKSKPWKDHTDEEKMYRLYETVGDVPKKEHAPNFKYDPARNKSNKYTEQENAIILEMAPEYSDEIIASWLFRTKGAIREQRLRLGVVRKRVWE